MTLPAKRVSVDCSFLVDQSLLNHLRDIWYAGDCGLCATGRQAVADTMKSTLPGVHMQQHDQEGS